ncbi:AbrB/MazE/SpoVT family DNA-binding domain-containing protein [Aggregatibacter kilianii]|uniref:AbrB/MazE/SpoVT family DNA-binding domain-containing protein n=1 Tax=Aggregatibacter kilianii TaxID=2025884 RepID=UPI000D644DD3|nr:AbrB/MazE/SpoVT family DNA-binding domain-containing protein [Aggregatibacter kilianii]
MNVTLRKLGNSQAVIIPKAILLQLGLSESLNMEVVQDKIVLSKPKTPVREGWALAAQEIAAEGDDTLVLDMPLESDEEWQW